MALPKINRLVLLIAFVSAMLVVVFAARMATVKGTVVQKNPTYLNVQTSTTEFIFFEAIGNRMLTSVFK